MSDDDAELYARWRSGDEDAGRQMFRRYGRPVLRFFRSKFPEAAEDLTQDVFARFFRAKRKNVVVRSVLFGIANEVLGEEVGRRKPGALTSVTSVADVEAASSTGLLQRQRLLRALQSLPLDQQIVIELHYWEGMSSQELGQALHISASAARGRLSLARQRLQETLGKGFLKRAPEEVVDLETWIEGLRDELDAPKR